MKTWHKKYEWTAYAACSDNPLHTAEYGCELTDDAMDVAGFEMTEVGLRNAYRVCLGCEVRPECIEWALREKACAVVVAGVYLPDPGNKKELRAAYSELLKSLPGERERRGDRI